MCKVPYTSHELAVTRVSPELAVTRITIIPSLQAPLLPRGSPDPAEPSFKPVKITSCSLGVLAKVLDRKHHVCFPVLSCVLWWFLELKKVPFPCYVNILSLHGAVHGVTKSRTRLSDLTTSKRAKNQSSKTDF